MKKLRFIVLFTTLNSVLAFAQTGLVGVNTPIPGSTLDVNGSFAGAYTSITANTYTAGENDFSIKWNGTADGSIALPASSSGADRSGRIYFLKNTSAGFILTVNANGSELIDNSSNVIIDPGEALLIIKTDNNTATGSTYMVLQISKTQESYFYSIVGTASQNIAGGVIGRLNFSAVDYSTNGGADFDVVTDIWTCPQTGWYNFSASAQATSQGAGSHSSLLIRKNNVGALANIYFFNPASPLINSGSVSKVVKLIQGDQITVAGQPCLGCSAGSTFSGKQLDISKL